MSINELEATILENLPEALPIVKADLAVIGTLSFSDQTLPISLIHTGPSSSLKSETINYLFLDQHHQELSDFLYRSDNFTPASFVSHAANVKASKLSEIDLLPKVKNRILLTKELSPIFSGNREELLKTFSVLTSVLDGQGYVSTSGVRGTRGYDEPIIFNWIGATKPFRHDVHYLLSALGPRLYFYNVSRNTKTLDELCSYAKIENPGWIRANCRKAVQDFLVDFFRENPKVCRRSADYTIPEDLLNELVLLTMVMSRLRAQFSLKEAKEKEDETEERFGSPDKENEHRAIQIFKMLARSSALVHGRTTVNSQDIELIRHIALSSCPEPRRKVFEAVIQREGFASTQQIIELSKMSKATAIHYMKELHHLNIVNLEDGVSGYTITLKEPFNAIVRENDAGQNGDRNLKEVGEWFEGHTKAPDPFNK